MIVLYTNSGLFLSTHKATITSINQGSQRYSHSNSIIYSVDRRRCTILLYCYVIVVL